MGKKTGAEEKRKPAENGDVNVQMEEKISVLHKCLVYISDHDSWTSIWNNEPENMAERQTWYHRDEDLKKADCNSVQNECMCIECSHTSAIFIKEKKCMTCYIRIVYCLLSSTWTRKNGERERKLCWAYYRKIFHYYNLNQVSNDKTP